MGRPINTFLTVIFISDQQAGTNDNRLNASDALTKQKIATFNFRIREKIFNNFIDMIE